MDTKKNGEKYKEVGLGEMLSQIRRAYDARENKPLELFCDFLMLAVAMLLTRAHILFGVCPLAIALLAASDRRVVPIFVGTLIGAFALPTGRDGYLIIYSLIFLARVITSAPLRGRVIFPRSQMFFCEAPQIRIATACFAGLGAGIYELLISDFAYYAILFSVGSVFFSAAGSFLFCGIYMSKITLPDLVAGAHPLKFNKINAKSIYTWAAFIGLCASVVLSLKSKSFIGLDLGLCITSFLCILMSRKANFVCGTLLALICSAICDVRYIPSFMLLAAVSGIITHLGEIYSLLFGVFTSVLFATLTNSLTGFLDTMPNIVIPALLVWPLFRQKNTQEEKEREAQDNKKAEAGGEQYMRLHRLSSVFSDLSRVFYDASGRTSRPAISEYFGTCDAICSKWCKKCERKNQCWEGGEKTAYRAMQGLSEKLYRRGITDKSCLPKSFSDTCPHINEIVGEIRESCATLTREKQKGDKSALIAFDYEMIANLLSESAKNDMLDMRRDERLSQLLSVTLQNDFGIKTDTVDVLGKRNKKITVTLQNPAHLFECEEKICERFSELCECAIGKMSVQNPHRQGVVTMQTLPKFTAEFGCAGVAAHDGDKNGDSICSFKNEDGFSYTILSDGMGSGEEAAFTSDFSNMFLEKMLFAGMSKTTSIRMLNNFLRYNDVECSSTVDLLEFDTLTGKASFVKSGAAPSIIKRGQSVFRVKSETMPIGLLHSIDAEKTDLSLRGGDVVIMLSDGISQGGDEKWLVGTIAETDARTGASELAEAILREAKKNAKKSDDMTVGVLKISEIHTVRESLAMSKALSEN